VKSGVFWRIFWKQRRFGQGFGESISGRGKERHAEVLPASDHLDQAGIPPEKKSGVGADRSGKNSGTQSEKNLHHGGSFWKKIFKHSHKF
jgi:hypothetical protein